jgi:hypothetical protein
VRKKESRESEWRRRAAETETARWVVAQPMPDPFLLPVGPILLLLLLVPASNLSIVKRSTLAYIVLFVLSFNSVYF